MTRVGTIPVDLVIPDLNVEQRYMMGLKNRDNDCAVKRVSRSYGI